MDSIIKVAICVDYDVFSVELAFNLLQRRVFADDKLNLCILTLDVYKVKEMAMNIKKCGFSNMNELTVTRDYQKAFHDANYFLLTTNIPEPSGYEDIERFQDLKHVFHMATLFDRLARPDARVLIIGPKLNTWLQIFAEVSVNLPAENFTGLSRHYVSKALALIARKLKCQVRDLSGVHVWAENHLDVMGGEKTTVYKKRNNNNNNIASLQPTNLQLLETQKLTELLPQDWIDNYLVPQSKAIHMITNSHCVLSAVCYHLADWCRGTADKTTVCMVTVMQRPGRINDGIYSSYPVIVDINGNISIVQDVYTESLLNVKLYKFYENQQKIRFHIRHFLNTTTNKIP